MSAPRRRKLAMLLALALAGPGFLAGCGGGGGAGTTATNPYAGRAGQERYCHDQGWAYDAKDNSCHAKAGDQ